MRPFGVHDSGAPLIVDFRLFHKVTDVLWHVHLSGA